MSLFLTLTLANICVSNFPSSAQLGLAPLWEFKRRKLPSNIHSVLLSARSTERGAADGQQPAGGDELKHIQADHYLRRSQEKAISAATNSYFSPAAAFYHSKFLLQLIQRYWRSRGPEMYSADQIRAQLHIRHHITSVCGRNHGEQLQLKVKFIISKESLRVDCVFTSSLMSSLRNYHSLSCPLSTSP